MTPVDAVSTLLIAVIGGVVSGLVVWRLQNWWQGYVDSRHPWPYYVAIRPEPYFLEAWHRTVVVEVTNRMTTRAELSFEFAWTEGVVGPTESVRVETSNENVTGKYSFIPPKEKRKFTVISGRSEHEDPPKWLVIMDTRLKSGGVPGGPSYPLDWSGSQELTVWAGRPRRRA